MPLGPGVRHPEHSFGESRPAASLLPGAARAGPPGDVGAAPSLCLPGLSLGLGSHGVGLCFSVLSSMDPFPVRLFFFDKSSLILGKTSGLFLLTRLLVRGHLLFVCLSFLLFTHGSSCAHHPHLSFPFLRFSLSPFPLVSERAPPCGRRLPWLCGSCDSPTVGRSQGEGRPGDPGGVTVGIRNRKGMENTDLGLE